MVSDFNGTLRLKVSNRQRRDGIRSSVHQLSPQSEPIAVPVYERYLPGVTAPPAGFSRDAESLAARLLSHKGELSHCTTSETLKCSRHCNTHHCCPSNKEEEGEREGQGIERHPGRKKMKQTKFTCTFKCGIQLTFKLYFE